MEREKHLSPKRLIVFFVPPIKEITGGLMSIFSIAAVARQFFHLHGSTVQLCVYPGFPSYGRNELFENDEEVTTLDEIVEMGVPDYLQLHIPDYASNAILDALEPYKAFLEAIPVLTVNLLNQNILLMPEPPAAARWFRWTPHVTQTTAHDRYTTQEVADLFNMPLYHLSVYLDPRQYERRPYVDKENVIVCSPDVVAEKEGILKLLTSELPEYELAIVHDMTYEQYKDLIARAKYSLTFGEGFDAYFLESCFSGAVAFAVYNDDFFPHQEFAELPNVYRSYEAMAQGIVDDMKRLDHGGLYSALVDRNFAEIVKFYDFDKYVENVGKFFEGAATFLPGSEAAPRLMGRIASERADDRARYEANIHDLHAQLEEMRLIQTQLEEMRLTNEHVIEQLHIEIEQLRGKNELLQGQLTGLEATRLMRYTRPYRKIYAQMRRRFLRPEPERP